MPDMDRQPVRPERGQLLSPEKPERAPHPVHAPDLMTRLGPPLGNQARQRFAQACPLRLPTPALCPYGGVCHTCPPRVQAKLTVNQPGDAYEQEADRVAEAVLRMPDPGIPAAERLGDAPGLQRQACPECEEEIHRQPLAEEEREEEELHRQPEAEERLSRQTEEEEPEGEEPLMARELPGRVPAVTPRLEAEIRSLKGGGRPLPESERAFFEPRFGYDFRGVRLHTDTSAVALARRLESRAFTRGSDIVFGAGEYVNASLTGRRLLAHELTHVVQQRSVPGIIHRLEDFLGCGNKREEKQKRAIVSEALEIAKKKAMTAKLRMDNWVQSPEIYRWVGVLFSNLFKTKSESDREKVRNVITDVCGTLSILTFRCAPRGEDSPEERLKAEETCKIAGAYVKGTLPVYLCDRFFKSMDLLTRSRLVVHEATHLTGIGPPRGKEDTEEYEKNFDCEGKEEPTATWETLKIRADRFTHFIYCLASGGEPLPPMKLEFEPKMIQVKKPIKKK